jgi:hypothetical protein
LRSESFGGEFPPRGPNKRGSGNPHGVSHSPPKREASARNPQTARRDRGPSSYSEGARDQRPEEAPDWGPNDNENTLATSNRRARADGRSPRNITDPQPTSLVHGTRLSPLLEGLGPPSARPSPGPDGSCPRRTNSARTTSRPVTRNSRATGDPPPTPHHVLGTRRTQLST